MGREDKSKMAKRRPRESRAGPVAKAGPAQAPSRILLPDEMARVLDSDVSGKAYGGRRAVKMVTLPCGFQMVFEPRTGPVHCRAPREYTIASCPRLTLDELCKAIDNMGERLALLEGGSVEAHGESADSSGGGQRSGELCPEVCDEASQEHCLGKVDALSRECAGSVGDSRLPLAEGGDPEYAPGA